MASLTRVLVALALVGCGSTTTATKPDGEQKPAGRELRHPSETRLADVVQLTYGANENAEAYWSFDGRHLIFQSNRAPHACDQIFRMPIDGSAEPSLLSTGKGRTTCSYFMPGDDRILYASTHLAGDACPPAPDHSQGYVWPLYPEYDIFVANADGSDPRQLTTAPGYDAEATVCGKDGSILFTSTRDGDLELYRMDADGGNVVRLTHDPGYDGGAFFSADCSKIVWRASRPTGDALADYQRLLAQNLVRPSALEIYVANADGSDQRQITYLGAASFAPFFSPDGSRVLFSSNYPDPRGREFDIWAVNVDGTNLERITYADGFDGFPMFSPDGHWLAFSSNRNNQEPGQTDVFVARWVADAQPAEAREPTAVDRVAADIAWLADDARGGRGLGSPGLAASADYLEARLKELGVEPAVDGGYRHAFDVAMTATQGETTAVALDGAPVAPDQLAVATASGSGEVAGVVVAAGYGITAPEHGIDDYKRVKAKGKIVVVRRFTPSGGAFADDKLQRKYSDLAYKAWNAREHGAVGLIVVDQPPPGAEATEEAPLPRLGINRHGDAGIPIVFVSRAAGAGLFKGRHKATLAVSIVVERAPAHNVVGVIRAGAADKLPGVVVIGAHYDHLGMGQEGSLAAAHGGEAPPEVHNGADDNASGTAALLEVARELVARRGELRRDVYVVAFSAEETGILGSSAFVRAPPPGLAMDQVVAMLNMDMVGRLRRNALSVLGGDSAAEWMELVTPVCAAARVACALDGDGYGPSDQTPFYAARVPVLHFFTGAHTEYHKPSDDAHTVNAAGAARIAHIVAGVGLAVAAREQPLTYKEAPAPEPAGDVRSYGASMGTIPDYSAAESHEGGVLLAGVRAGGPADKAGIVKGDRVVKIGSHEVRNIRDMMFALQKHKPGDTVPVVVVRDGKRVEVQLTFGKSTRVR